MQPEKTPLELLHEIFNNKYSVEELQKQNDELRVDIHNTKCKIKLMYHEKIKLQNEMFNKSPFLKIV